MRLTRRLVKWNWHSKPTANSFLTYILLALLVSSATAFALTDELSGEDIAFAIETDLYASGIGGFQLVDVEVKDGVAILSGRVSNILARDKAAEIARSIKGVESVVNDITVKAADRLNTELENAIEIAFANDPATESYQIDVEADDGSVTLTGAVDSWAEKHLAGIVAKGVAGVEELTNKIDIIYPGVRTEQEMREEINARLDEDAWLIGRQINVSVDGGTVTLTGSVASAAEKRRAVRRAWVYGTEEVNADNLEVDWDLKGISRESAKPERSDTWIEKAVNRAFDYDPRVSPFNIKVEAENGIVKLTGIVDNRKAKAAAKQDAENTTGVIWVKNHIRVRPYEIPDDETLADKVEIAIADSPLLDKYDIDATAENGLVYLEGLVHTPFEKWKAKDIAWGIRGVVDVENRIETRRGWTWKGDPQIKMDVWEQLYWSPLVRVDDIEITVDDAVVTLEGEVDTWIARRQAQLNAYQAGAKAVDNELKINSNDHSYFENED